MTAETSILPLSLALQATRVIDLAHRYEVGMPQSPNHPPYRMVPERRHGDYVREDGGSAANELIVLGGHVGTHVDALGHVSQDGRLHGGIPAGDVQSHKGLARLGIDEFAPFIGRGVLLDVAAHRGVDVLEPGEEVTPDDLVGAQERAGVDIRPGDAILVATGWSAHWTEKALFEGQIAGVPGPGAAAGAWLAERSPRLVGGETIAFEHIAAGRGHALLPVHRLMLVERGVNIMETMRLTELRASGASEFLLVVSPLPIVGGSGAPVRPLALVAE
jgi:kynurenine formamidase